MRGVEAGGVRKVVEVGVDSGVLMLKNRGKEQVGRS